MCERFHFFQIFRLNAGNHEKFYVNCHRMQVQCVEFRPFKMSWQTLSSFFALQSMLLLCFALYMSRFFCLPSLASCIWSCSSPRRQIICCGCPLEQLNSSAIPWTGFALRGWTRMLLITDSTRLPSSGAERFAALCPCSSLD